jgi:hypothetical protein
MGTVQRCVGEWGPDAHFQNQATPKLWHFIVAEGYNERTVVMGEGR